MLAGLAPTPPETTGSYEEPMAILGYAARLLVREGQSDIQPLRTRRDSAVLVTASCLYNREELTGIFGWSPTSAAAKNDSAFVLEAFERWGDACAAHLSGVFSLSVWRPHARSLLCAISHGGRQPIYYWRRGTRFAFASTLPALLKLPSVSRRLNEEAFADFFANVASDSDATLYHDIRRVRNGHILRVDASGVRTERYSAPKLPPVLRLPSEIDYAMALREQLTAAVRRALRGTPGNIGLLLSGGLDSSALAAIAGRMLASEGRRLTALHIHSPSSNRYHDPSFELDESKYVRSLQSHASHIDFEYLTTQSHPLSRASWDEYFNDNCVPFESLLSTDPALDQTIQRLDLSLLLDGIGGNHVVSLEAMPSGYLAHLAISGRWLSWWREARGHARVYHRSMRLLARHTLINPTKRLLRGRWAHVPSQRAIQFLHPGFQTRTGVTKRFRAFYNHWHRPRTDFRRHLYDVVHTWSGLHFGTEPSVFQRHPHRYATAQPLYDRRLNEFCLSLPLDQQIRDGWDRRVLREAMRGLLPDEVRLRLNRGFPQPEFQRNFTMAEVLLGKELTSMGSSPLVREVLDYDRIRSLWHLRQAQPTFRHEILLTKCITVGAFLRWHERNGA